MRPAGPVLLYAGVALTAAGFGLIAFTWGEVAALEAVALQLPFLVSGGLTGLGLVIVGATAVNIYSKQREGAQRERQTQQLLEVLRQVTIAVGGTLPEEQSLDHRGFERPVGAENGAVDDSDADDDEDASSTQELSWGR